MKTTGGRSSGDAMVFLDGGARSEWVAAALRRAGYQVLIARDLHETRSLLAGDREVDMLLATFGAYDAARVAWRVRALRPSMEMLFNSVPADAYQRSRCARRGRAGEPTERSTASYF